MGLDACVCVCVCVCFSLGRLLWPRVPHDNEHSLLPLCTAMLPQPPRCVVPLQASGTWACSKKSTPRQGGGLTSTWVTTKAANQRGPTCLPAALPGRLMTTNTLSAREMAVRYPPSSKYRKRHSIRTRNSGAYPPPNTPI